MHELIYLRGPNHTLEFLIRLERATPDYEQRGKWLTKHGEKYAGMQHESEQGC